MEQKKFMSVRGHLERRNPPEGFEEKEARRTVGKVLPVIVKQIINERTEQSLRN